MVVLCAAYGSTGTVRGACFLSAWMAEWTVGRWWLTPGLRPYHSVCLSVCVYIHTYAVRRAATLCFVCARTSDAHVERRSVRVSRSGVHPRSHCSDEWRVHIIGAADWAMCEDGEMVMRSGRRLAIPWC